MFRERLIAADQITGSFLRADYLGPGFHLRKNHPSKGEAEDDSYG